MVAGPNLASHQVTVHRRVEQLDPEGRPVALWEPVSVFYAGFGSNASTRLQVVGAAGERVDAAVSAPGRPDVRVGDKVEVADRQWACVGVVETPLTRRVLLAAWRN